MQATYLKLLVLVQDLNYTDENSRYWVYYRVLLKLFRLYNGGKVDPFNKIIKVEQFPTNIMQNRRNLDGY